jgi:uracil-DNA glycosylase
MKNDGGAAPFVPNTHRLTELATAARSCRGCDLYEAAAQTVFGAGPGAARMVLIGEQPGDREDRTGQPFVGPAGRLLDRALAAAGIARDGVYVTNAVKHFKFEHAERGKRRIHKSPNRMELVACRPWLFAELQLIRPDVAVLLGATAAKSLMGSDFRLTQHRGEVLRLPPEERTDHVDPDVVVTIHPSAVLRGPRDARDEAFDGLVSDLRFAAGRLPVRGSVTAGVGLGGGRLGVRGPAVSEELQRRVT